MRDIPHQLHLVHLVVACVVGAVVYLVAGHDRWVSHRAPTVPTVPRHDTTHVRVQPPGIHHTTADYEDTDTVLPSYVESRSIPIHSENVLTTPYLQRTNNRMPGCSVLPTEVMPELAVVEQTPAASRCPRVNAWCSPLCGLYV
jgi:hypothetical protein